MMQSMPISVTVSEVVSSGLGVRFLAGSSLDLAPGKKAAIPFLLVRPSPAWPIRLLTTERVHAENINLELRGQVRLQPPSELSTLAIEPVRTFELKRTIDAKILILGTPMWFQIVLLILTVGVCLFAWKTWLKPAIPVSRSFQKILLDGTSFHEELTIPLNTARQVIVGNTVVADVKSGLHGAVLAFVIQSKKPVFPMLGPKRGLYLYTKDSDLTYTGKRYDKEQRSWVEMDLPLSGFTKEALPANYRTALAIVRGGERITITFSRS